MLFTKRGRFLLLSLAVIVTISSRVDAQPLAKSHPSLESMIAPAEFVAIGRIKGVTEHVILLPGTIDKSGNRDERGKFEYTLTPKFDEVLKDVNRDVEGDEVETLRTIDFSDGIGEQLEQSVKKETVGFWLIGPKPKAKDPRQWKFVPLGEHGVDHHGYRIPSTMPPVFANDLSILKSKEDILERAREYGPISQMEHDPKKESVVQIHIPWTVLGEIEGGDYNLLQMAIDSELETTARQLILSPADYVTTTGLPSDPHPASSVRVAGIDLLRHIKTDANIKLLQNCLDSSILPFEQDVNDQRVRNRAYELLLHWHIDQSPPQFNDAITELFLPGTDINDQTLATVGKLSNLEKLNLWGTRISHVGIGHLANLKKLQVLELDNAHLTDEALRVLRSNGQLHLISQAKVQDETHRPASADEVARLSFWAAPFTDAGLKELAVFKNSIFIDLRGTGITDAGLAHLTDFKTLKWLWLQHTNVTAAGVAKLREALPNCSIEASVKQGE